jgi:hypothetical protein
VLGISCKLKDDVEDVIEKPPPRPLSKEYLGLNSFFNDDSFGSAAHQAKDIFNNLGLRRLRVLVRWDDHASPVPEVQPNFNFITNVLDALPSTADVLVVTTGVPSWMNDPSNWIDLNPRRTFIEKWFTPLLSKLKQYSKVKSIQIWNEPNDSSLEENKIMKFDVPENYIELVWLAKREVERLGLNVKLLNAATTAINQKSNSPLDYNKKLVSLGLKDYVDIFAVHFYGSQLEQVVRKGGVREFLKDLRMEVWVTESGERGVTKQLDYASRYWPYLIKEIPAIKRIYIYIYADRDPPNRTYGLRNLSKDTPYSDLYFYLRGTD